MVYVKPTSDIFIKYLFGREEDKGLLLNFVNSVQENMNFPFIKDIELKNTFNIKNLALDKESVLDIKAVSETGEIYNIEVQTSGDNIFRHRSLYYWSRLYSSQLKEGEIYGSLCPVICINILDFHLFKETGRYHLCFMLREFSDPELFLSDHLVMHYLELPELKGYNKGKQLEKWLYYLKNEGKTEGDEAMRILLKENPEINKAHDKYVAFTRDEELLDAYEAHMKWQRDYNSGIESARREGEKKGIRIGEERGRQEGRQEGLEKGQYLAQLAMAEKMLKKGYDIETVSEFTQIPVSDLKKI
ncbi:MAG: Rpn family recombination-promoting nuclease/putative transposase [Desulforegulaceae bacterium]|nr:Rpn family recombination-promoting nuclease/putative transposase [Desulforegulaceae bacterium]